MLGNMEILLFYLIYIKELFKLNLRILYIFTKYIYSIVSEFYKFIFIKLIIFLIIILK